MSRRGSEGVLWVARESAAAAIERRYLSPRVIRKARYGVPSCAGTDDRTRRADLAGEDESQD
jgi:hypothetical protein